MFEVREAKNYTKWIKGLKDRRARIRIGMRIERLQQGNFGDSKDFGDITELRIDCGPGYRVYCTRHGKLLYILLAGGDKSTQKKDIKTAREMAQNLREGKDDDRF